MIEINSKNIKRWSRIGQRATFGLAMVELAQENDDLIVMTADVSTSAGLERFKSSFPEKYYDVGISEQNMMGVATGLASLGNKVFTTTFAPFQSMRCLEQIRVNLGYMRSKICMVGLASGLYHAYLGNTHCCIEDVAVLRGIPNLTIVSPADGLSLVKCLASAVDYKESLYIRLSGGASLPIVYEEDFDFVIGKANEIKKGTDIVIIATGTMVHRALQVADYFAENNISCAVIDMHTIKPIDKSVILEYKDYNLIVTIEEHNIIGGLGSAVSEVLSSVKHTGRQLSLGVEDFYPHGTDYDNVMDQCGLSVDKIVEQIKNVL